MNNIIFKTLLLKGEAGNDIQSVEKTDTSGLVDTYTITLTDGSTHTFNVTNGKSIVSIEKTSSVGYVDTYTITYNDGSTDTFEITLATITVDDALSDSSTNPVENRVVTDALNNKSNNSNLATVESGTTASQAYTVGDYLVYNWQLCKVISAIAQGDTLTVGTNIAVTTSGGEFTRLNSDLSVNTTTQTFSNAQFDITATTKYINSHVAECNINFEFKQALSLGSFDITLTGLTKLPVFVQQRTVMIGTYMLYCTLTPNGVFGIINNSGATIGVGYSQNVTFNYMTN